MRSFHKAALLGATVLSAALLTLSPTAAGNGHGGGNGGGMGHAQMNGHGNMNGNGFGHEGADMHGHDRFNEDVHGTPNGGNSASHISESGRLNSNGPNARHRLYGQERAAYRHKLHDNKSSNLVHTKTTTKAKPNGGRSAAHISDQGVANTNGPNADARLKGKARADVRPDRDEPND